MGYPQRRGRLHGPSRLLFAVVAANRNQHSPDGGKRLQDYPGLRLRPAGRRAVLEARQQPRRGLSIVLGLLVWIAMEFIAPEAALPPQFAGFIASALG